MPYIIAITTYPSHKQNDVVKKYLELIPKYPGDESLGEVVAQPVALTKNGFKIVSIWEVKEGKFDEAFTRVNTYFYEFKDIEGHEVAIKVWNTFPEAIAMAGIPVPE
jgi:hypothetical protein